MNEKRLDALDQEYESFKAIADEIIMEPLQVFIDLCKQYNIDPLVELESILDYV